MSTRSWNPVVLIVILIAAIFLLSFHCYSLRQQITEFQIQAIQYRKLVERLGRQKTEMRLNLGHLQRAMEKHTQRAKQRFDFEETLRAKESLITRLKNQIEDMKTELESHKKEASKSKTVDEHHDKSGDSPDLSAKDAPKDQSRGKKVPALSNLNKKANDLGIAKQLKGDLFPNMKVKEKISLTKKSASIKNGHTLKFNSSPKLEAGMPKKT